MSQQLRMRIDCQPDLSGYFVYLSYIITCMPPDSKWHYPPRCLHCGIHCVPFNFLWGKFELHVAVESQHLWSTVSEVTVGLQMQLKCALES